MAFGLPVDVVAVFAVTLVGGVVMGITGFGFAVITTAALASVLVPSDAVVVLILPLLATNVSLVTELDRDSYRQCARRFWPFLAAAVVGTTAGMAVLDDVPADATKTALGALTLAYAVLTQPFVTVPGKERAAAICFQPGTAAKTALGLVSGFVFGATNVAIQVVAYLRSLDLDRSTFVGVLASILLGVSVVRVGLAVAFGLYGGTDLFALSATAVVPSVVGVRAGTLARHVLSERAKQSLALALLVAVGVRLLV